MTDRALGVLETTGLTPALVALDHMLKAAAIGVLQMELNDFYGVCLKISGDLAAVQAALDAGTRIAERMGGRPITDLIPQLAIPARTGVFSATEFSPLIRQEVVFPPESGDLADPDLAPTNDLTQPTMNPEHPQALGFLETQGFTAVIEAVDTACKAAHVSVVGKEKLGGGYVTIVIQGELSAVEAAVAAGKGSVEVLGKLIAAHVIARPNAAILSLLPEV
jgi:microcompartment protein CcmL/EutN